MSNLVVGEQAPNFTLASTNGENISLSDFKDKNDVVLFFYPKDHTPGCTNEASEFRDYFKEFNAKGYTLLGISKDSLKSHIKFKEKLNLPFELLSDEERVVHELYGVLKPKKMFGKDVIGTVRSTFIIDKNGKLVKEFRNVKTTGHAEEILQFLTEKNNDK
ncbi:thioredoxin-dependent thiol peroxidase [Alkaliphilus transvaalensis]|uniref:thioredoxin-dependent thiol peroxidase n=1 Tax=Alkaliphilus transvaalensis TaxID=114628 RepID=UPI00047D948F|nr:thioredoxin-dependent thiol peroxidase [Alkaliphilus transvaalensis]